jgi:Zn-dependent peptidase ImmA (M78 family)
MNPLDEFILMLSEKYSMKLSEISPQTVAQEWIAHSGLSQLPSLGEIHHQLERYGVSLKGVEMPDLRGHHYFYRGGDPTILYENGEWQGAIEFTLLHELYEIILERATFLEPTFFEKNLLSLEKKVSQETSNLEKKFRGKESRCAQANQFAAAVLMQEDIFRQSLFQSHFDLIWLHHHFCRSYAAIAIRAVEVLASLEKKARFGRGVQLNTPTLNCDFLVPPYNIKIPIAFGCVIYQPAFFEKKVGKETLNFSKKIAKETSNLEEKAAEETSNDFRVSCAVYTNELRNGFSAKALPKRKDQPLPNSIVELVLQTQQPQLQKQADLTLLARPVFWFKKPAKVIVEMMRHEDSWLLQAQAEGIRK